MEYTWAVTSLNKATEGALVNVVVQTYWTCTGTDADGDSGTFSGATPFPLSGAGSDTFTPYEALTESDVTGWIQAAVVGPYKDHVDGQIAKQIALKKQPVEEVPSSELPWAPPAVTPPSPGSAE